jgi:hypothetical protein
MYIPNYQIHNILKEFTQQLKNGGCRADAGHRRETVVNKVAGTIMDRVTRISEEEARRHIRPTGADHPLPASPVDKRQPTTFHYHTLDQHHRKLKNHLCVEDSRQIIDRFFSMVDTPRDDVSDE